MSGPAAIVDVELTADEREILDALRVAGAYSSDANVIRSALAALARHLLPTIWLPGEIFAQRASRRDLTAGADCARDRGASRAIAPAGSIFRSLNYSRSLSSRTRRRINARSSRFCSRRSTAKV